MRLRHGKRRQGDAGARAEGRMGNLQRVVQRVRVVRIFTDEKLPINSKTNFWEFD